MKPSPIRAIYAWLGLVGLIVILASPILTYPLGRDQGEFATIAQGILWGRVPYLDLWNPKPPAIFYTYALMIRTFGANALAIRALDLLTFPLVAWGLYGIARRLEDHLSGLWAVALYAAFYFSEDFWTLSQNDGIASIAMVLAVWCLFHLLDDEQHAPYAWGWALGAGLWCGIVLWFKYPFILFVGAVALGTVWLQPRWSWRNAGAFVGAVTLVGVLGMGALWRMGAFEEWIISVQTTGGYTAQGYDWQIFWRDMAHYGRNRWAHWWVLGVLVGMGAFLQLGEGWRSGHKSSLLLQSHLVTIRHKWSMIDFWLVGCTLAMLVQAKGYDYHWLPMLPPLVLRGTNALKSVIAHCLKLCSRGPLPRWLPVYTTIIPIVVALAHLTFSTWGTTYPYLRGAITKETYLQGFVGGEYVASESVAMAQWLRERVPPTDTLYIWGFRPEIYYLSQLRPATRFIFQFPLVGAWYPPEWKQENVDVLWASLPPYVLVLQADYMPWVTGRDADSATLLNEYQALQDWLIFNYERTTQIGNFIVWQRKNNKL